MKPYLENKLSKPTRISRHIKHKEQHNALVIYFPMSMQVLVSSRANAVCFCFFVLHVLLFMFCYSGFVSVSTSVTIMVDYIYVFTCSVLHLNWFGCLCSVVLYCSISLQVLAEHIMHFWALFHVLCIDPGFSNSCLYLYFCIWIKSFCCCPVVFWPLLYFHYVYALASSLINLYVTALCCKFLVFIICMLLGGTKTLRLRVMLQNE